MASIGWEGDRARILYRDAKGKQKTIRLGECSQRLADAALAAVEHLLIAKRHGSVPHPDAIRWLSGVDDVVYARVVAHGLAQPRENDAMPTLGELRDRFDATVQVKPGTVAAYKQGLDSVCAHLGRDRTLASITPLDADGWRRSLVDEELATATVSKRVQTVRNLFRKAVRWRMLSESPFADVRAGKQHNPERQRFIDRATIGKVIDAAPDAEWRLLVALSRFAGLRCPSEHLALTWADVDWERSALTVRAVKTNTARRVPITPDLLPHLQAAFDAAPAGQTWVIARYRQRNANLRTQLRRIIDKAGLSAWPRLWHNLRGSCQTEWQERFPLADVCQWIGNTPDVAARHYLTAQNAHFEAAVKGTGQAATNPATQARPSDPTASTPKTQDPQYLADLVGVGVRCDPVENQKVGAVGFEPTKA